MRMLPQVTDFPTRDTFLSSKILRERDPGKGYVNVPSERKARKI